MERDSQNEPGELRRIVFFSDRVGRYYVTRRKEEGKEFHRRSLARNLFRLYILDTIRIVQLYRTTDCLWSRELVNYSGRCLLFIYSYTERESEREEQRGCRILAAAAQNSSKCVSVAAYVITICPNSGPTTVYLSSGARRSLTHRCTPRYLAQTRLNYARIAKSLRRGQFSRDPGVNVFSASPAREWIRRRDCRPTWDKRPRSYVIVRTTILELATNSVRAQKRRPANESGWRPPFSRSGLPMNGRRSLSRFASSCS